jgi:hypothetical protein
MGYVVRPCAKKPKTKPNQQNNKQYNTTKQNQLNKIKTKLNAKENIWENKMAGLKHKKARIQPKKNKNLSFIVWPIDLVREKGETESPEKAEKIGQNLRDEVVDNS